MLEQKHNKRAAISQASSNSNPKWLSRVTSAPSNPLHGTHLGTPEVPGERKRSPTLRGGSEDGPHTDLTAAKRSRVAQTDNLN